MLLEAGAARALGETQGSRLRFVEAPKADSAWAGRRLLLLDDQPAFELSFWCGTCPCLFQRLEGANSTFSGDDRDGPVSANAHGINDQVVNQFGSLLPYGQYVPLLIEVTPRLVHPADPADYFTNEQVATWGVNGFWGLPEYPRTPYYRTYQTRVDADAHLFEFVVPMVPPSWNDRDRVAAYSADLTRGVTPTAVAVATLDVCAPAVDHGRDYYAHWMLTHFLLDGHHKTQAAADTGRPLLLLSLLSTDAGLGTARQVAQVLDIRAADQQSRHPNDE